MTTPEPKPLSRRWLASADHPVARFVRAARTGVQRFTLPAPRFIVKPMLWTYLGVRTVYYFFRRIMFAEPLFKAYCTSHGRRVRTDIHVPYIRGKGELHVGDDFLVDGHLTVVFAARFSDRPCLRIGNQSGLSNGCSFVVGKRIELGDNVRVGKGVSFRDSGGHASDPALRKAGAPPADADVRPILVGNNVWIGTEAIIMPGATIGEGSIVGARSVVSGTVAPYTVVAGNPARRIATLEVPADAATAAQYTQ